MAANIVTLDIIVSNINGKTTVLYDNESNNLQKILKTINDTLPGEALAYIKTVDKQKYLSFKDNAISLDSIIS